MTDDIKDLVERLRTPIDWAHSLSTGDQWQIDEDRKGALSAIERLVAERDRARKRARTLRRDLKIERMEPCGSCGHKVTEDCPRAPAVACWRDYHGGTREALSSIKERVS